MEEQTYGAGGGGSPRDPQAHGRAKRNPSPAPRFVGASRARRVGVVAVGARRRRAIEPKEGGEGDLVM